MSKTDVELWYELGRKHGEDILNLRLRKKQDSTDAADVVAKPRTPTGRILKKRTRDECETIIRKFISDNPNSVYTTRNMIGLCQPCSEHNVWHLLGDMTRDGQLVRINKGEYKLIALK